MFSVFAMVFLRREYNHSAICINFVVERCICYANLSQVRGRTAETDDLCTSIDLAKHLFEKYGWTLVEIMMPTEKKSCEGHDFPFLKLSKGVLKAIPCWWYKEAVVEIQTTRKEDISFSVHLA